MTYLNSYPSFTSNRSSSDTIRGSTDIYVVKSIGVQIRYGLIIIITKTPNLKQHCINFQIETVKNEPRTHQVLRSRSCAINQKKLRNSHRSYHVDLLRKQSALIPYYINFKIRLYCGSDFKDIEIPFQKGR